MFLIGFFYLLTTFIGFGARAFLGEAGVEAAGTGGNLAAPNLAAFLGGGEGTFGGDGIWVPPAGSDSTRGFHGSGAGRGGSGGIDEDPFTCGDADLVGGGGGGGGAGGCGGQQGSNGQPGGGSFAIVCVNSSITVRNTDLDLADGGGAELDRRERGEGALEAGEGGAGAAEDDGGGVVGGHGGTPSSAGISIRALRGILDQHVGCAVFVGMPWDVRGSCWSSSPAGAY